MMAFLDLYAFLRTAMVGLALNSFAVRAEPVAVAAGADPAYLAKRAVGTGAARRAQTFVLARGSMFGGLVTDASLEGARFDAIAATLAPALARQKFLPTPIPAQADLIIVVHWGITRVREDAGHGQQDWQHLQDAVGAYNGSLAKAGSADPGDVLASLNTLRQTAPRAGLGPADNAQLLGYSSELQKAEYESMASPSGVSERDRRLQADLVDERYFVILMAYDLAAIRGAKKGAKSALVWSAHVSMRAVGRNFAEALPIMSQVAGRYLGRQIDGLVLDGAAVPKGKVEVGTAQPVGDPER